MAKNELVEARKYFNQALSLNPDDYESLKDLGNTYQASGDVDTAKNYYQKALSVNNTYAPALTNLGNIELNHGNKKEALSFLPRLNSELMRIAKTGVIKKRNASRNVSRITKRINSL